METGSNEKEEKGNGISKQASKKGYTINDMGKRENFSYLHTLREQTKPNCWLCTERSVYVNSYFYKPFFVQEQSEKHKDGQKVFTRADA